MSEVLKEAMSKFGGKKLSISTGKVTEIKGTTCTVERENLPSLLDVRLQALEGDFENKLLIKPKQGSEVVCLAINGETAETSIVKYTEIESIEIVVGGAILKMESGKIQLKNKSVDLKVLLSELFAELQKAIIQTPSGPGTFSPPNVVKFTELETKIKQLFE